jgi:colanic acid biosynthesis glycosyl transferase WcaI
LTRIAIWSPNYAPELTGIPPLVTDAAEWLAGRGHDVRVVTAFPNYPSRRIDNAYRGALWRAEERNGVRLERSWLRVRPGESFVDKAAYEASFATVSLPLAVRAAARSDVLVCVVPSLLAASYARVVKAARSRCRLVLWFQDLVAEGAAALEPSPLARRGLALARRAERFAAGGADRVIVCSPGFRDYLVRLGANADDIETLYNWVDTDWITPTPATSAIPKVWRRSSKRASWPLRAARSGSWATVTPLSPCAPAPMARTPSRSSRPCHQRSTRGSLPRPTSTSSCSAV